MIEIRITGNTTADIHDQMHQYLQSAAQVPAPSPSARRSAGSPGCTTACLCARAVP